MAEALGKIVNMPVFFDTLRKASNGKSLKDLHTKEEKIDAIGDSITVTWGDGWKLEDVPIGQFFDRAAEFVSQSDAALVARWADANQIGLNRFWAKSKTDALALKKLVRIA